MGQQAESANQYLSKGRQVFVEGRLRQEEFTGQDGSKRTSLEVTATDVQFLACAAKKAVAAAAVTEADSEARDHTIERWART
ncbi:MAG: single-stranded DNA-binding protein [Acidobacteriota bacterium]